MISQQQILIFVYLYKYLKMMKNIIRCSYMLTNLSLEKAAEKYTDVRKAVGDLNYNVNPMDRGAWWATVPV